MKGTSYEQTNYTLPTYWASALINGENELEGDEMDCFEAFLEGEKEGMGEGHWSIKTEGDEIVESSFMKYHDAEHYGILACDCFRYVWSRRLEQDDG